MIPAPSENLLRYNSEGGAIVRQSDLSSWSRCGLQKHYYDIARYDPDATQPGALSATVYGTVMHYCLMLLEQMHHEGREDALAVALSTFEHYSHPENLPLIAEPITQWIGRETYGGLRERGRMQLNSYNDLMRKDASKLLALEYQFAVPLEVNGRRHTLTGTIDRLELASFYGKPFIRVSDFKSGKQPTYLRHNMQGTAYAYATTLPEFWHGWQESGMVELATFDPSTVKALEKSLDSYGYSLIENPWEDRRPLASRKFRWINIKELRYAEGGWRTPRDYQRLHYAVDAYVRSNEAGVYPVTTTGEVCMYCPFKGICAGIGLPADDDGAPR